MFFEYQYRFMNTAARKRKLTTLTFVQRSFKVMSTITASISPNYLK